MVTRNEVGRPERKRGQDFCGCLKGENANGARAREGGSEAYPSIITSNKKKRKKKKKKKKKNRLSLFDYAARFSAFRGLA